MRLLVVLGATIVLGADDTVECRSGRMIAPKGCYREAVRSLRARVDHEFALKWEAIEITSR
jgi:hypothetical protein